MPKFLIDLLAKRAREGGIYNVRLEKMVIFEGAPSFSQGSKRKV